MIPGLDAFLTSRRNKVFTLDEATKELGAPAGSVKESLMKIAASVGADLHDLGNGAYIFSSEKELVSYRLFKQVAPFINREEWDAHRSDLPYLAYVSRRREIGAHRMSADDLKRIMES